MTWDEVRGYLAHSKVLIIPIGTCEQHGMHLPLNADTLVSERVSEDVSRATGIAIAPTVNYGVNLPCDSEFSGTNSVSGDTLKAYVAEMLDWWVKQGFEQFYALSAHGDPIHLKSLSEANPEKLTVIELYDVEMADLLEKQAFTRHADEAETSVVMYLQPGALRKDKIKDFWTPPEEFMDYLYHRKTESIPGDPGPQGYPSAATTDKGKAIYERMRDRAIGIVQPSQAA